MRKTLKRLFTVFAVCILSSYLFAAEGTITFVKGKVEVQRDGAWIPLNVGDKVAQSEMISTGFKSEAKVKLMDSLLYLGPVTRVTLDALASSSSKDKVNVFLATGSVRSKVNHSGDKKVSYTVRTPIAVASVRGTDWAIDDSNNVSCFEGAVAVIPVQALMNMTNDADADDEAEDEESEEEGEDEEVTDLEEDMEDDSGLEDDGDAESQETSEESTPSEDMSSDGMSSDESGISGSSESTEPVQENNVSNEAPAPEKAPAVNEKKAPAPVSNDSFSSNASMAAFEDTLELPTTGVVVSANKNVQIANTTSVAMPKHNIEKKAADVVSAVTTEAAKQAPKVDRPVSTTVSDAISTGNVNAVSTGSININIKLPVKSNVSVDVTID